VRGERLAIADRYNEKASPTFLTGPLPRKMLGRPGPHEWLQSCIDFPFQQKNTARAFWQLL